MIGRKNPCRDDKLEKTGHFFGVFGGERSVNLDIKINESAFVPFVHDPRSKQGCFSPDDPSTPLKTNISPEKWWLEDAFPIELVPFSGTC